MKLFVTLTTIALVVATSVSTVSAQGPAPEPEKPVATDALAPVVQDDPDQDVNLAQPDFTLAALPTTLRLPRYKSAFRITHRFNRPVGQGDIGDFFSDAFGLDNGSFIGFEYRFGVFRGAQVSFHRTSDKTIQFLGQYDLKAQSASFPVGINLIAAIEGADNLTENHSPTLGVALSREVGQHAALYVEPLWVNNTNSLPQELVDDNSTFLVGLGARVRVRPTVYLVVEASPRVAGYDPGATQASFAIEKRSGGHSFQLNLSNGLGTTFGQLARGGFSRDDRNDWYLGFSISRKFY